MGLHETIRDFKDVNIRLLDIYGSSSTMLSCQMVREGFVFLDRSKVYRIIYD